MAKLIFGCGYLGLRVARLWKTAGHDVFAVTRSPARAVELSGDGLGAIVGDVAADAQVTLPSEVTTALFAVGYDRSSGQSIGDVYAGGLSRALSWLPDSIERVIYISSTGVYGQVTGDLVDESSPCTPIREGGKASLAAEQVLQRSRFADRSIILRLAGIYGPGRIPRASDLQAGRPIDAPASGWLNLIHVEDAARIVLLAEQLAPLPSSYVVSDGQPIERGEYYRELARLLHAPSPTFIDPRADSPAAQRAASDKRVNPKRLFDDLSPTFCYPGYREGLAAIIGEERKA